MVQSLQDETPSHMGVMPTFGEDIADVPAKPVFAIDASRSIEADTHPLDRAIVSGYVNGDFFEYAEMGESDPRFQARFFVLPRHGASSSEGCAKIAMQEDTHACWNDYNYHPYFTYDVPTLRQLAASDATAAAVLALKLESASPDETLFFKLRAAQLSGKPGPLVSYLRTHSIFFDDQSNEIVNVDDALELYAIALVVDAMGYPYIQATEIVATLDRHGVPSDMQDEAEADSQRLLAQLRE